MPTWPISPIVTFPLPVLKLGDALDPITVFNAPVVTSSPAKAPNAVLQ